MGTLSPQQDLTAVVAQATVAATEPAVTEASPQTAPLEPTVDELVAGSISRIPALTDHRPALEMVFVCHLTYREAADRLIALDELNVLRGWAKSDILTACGDLLTILDAGEETIKAEFDAATNDGTSYTDMKSRLDVEQQEQEQLKSAAMEVLIKIKEVCAALGLQNPDTEQATKTAVRPTLARQIMAKFIREEPPHTSVEETVSADWRTEPVIQTDDPAHKKFMIVIRWVDSKKDGPAVLRDLRNMGLDESKLIQLMGELAAKARKQIRQSDIVLANSLASYGQFSQQAQALSDVRAVVTSVFDFFFPKGKSTS